MRASLNVSKHSCCTSACMSLCWCMDSLLSTGGGGEIVGMSILSVSLKVVVLCICILSMVYGEAIYGE